MEVKKYYSENEVERSGVQQSKSFKLSKHAQETIFNMFTKNIYSRPIDSVVREITSNCFDSHIEAGVTDPVVIRYKTENNQDYISFIDVGIGMSPQRMDEVFTIYFESTKDKSNDLIGGYGLGGKTPLAYTDSFFIITVFDKKKYTYSIVKGPTSPDYDLLMTEDTNDRNGTEVKIPIKPHDVNLFVKALHQQLYYFENVIFENFPSELQNEYTIYRSQNFWYRGTAYSNKMHVCLGRVAYPIDFGALNIQEVNIPVAIKLNIGEIPVGVSRENIEYDPQTIAYLKSKINEVKKELREMLKKQYDTISSIEDFYTASESYGKIIIDKAKDIYLDVKSISDHQDIKFTKFPSIKIPSSSEIMSYLYDIKILGKKGKKNENWYSRSFIGMCTLNVRNIYYLTTDIQKNRKHSYMLSINDDRYYIIRLKDFQNEKTVNDTIINHFRVKNNNYDSTPTPPVTTSEIKDFKKFVAELDNTVRKYTNDYDSTIVPSDFRLERKLLNIANVHDMNAKFSVRNMELNYSTHMSLAQLISFKGTIFYGFRDDRESLEKSLEIYKEFDPTSVSSGTRNIFGGTYKTAFILISKQNEKAVKLHKNAHYIKEFIPVYLKDKSEFIIKIINGININNRYKKLPSTILNNVGFRNIDSVMYSSVLRLNSVVSSIKVTTLKNSENFYSSFFRKMNINFNYISQEDEQMFTTIEDSIKRNKFLDYIRIPDGNRDFSIYPELFELIKKVYTK